MAYTEHVGWMNYFPQETDIDFWATTINRWIKINFKSDSGKPPLVIGLEYQAIFD
jgi:hypothetical protein